MEFIITSLILMQHLKREKEKFVFADAFHFFSMAQ